MSVLRRRPSDEEGIALVAVIVIGAVIVLLLTVVARRSFSDLTQVTTDRKWEQAVHVADAGIDHWLFRLNQYPDATTLCGSSAYAPPAFATEHAERDWVFAQADAASACSNASERVRKTPEGDWVAIKAPSRAVIYAVGYVPSKANWTQRRALRIEYDFVSQFTPDVAVLTDADLVINGNPVVQGQRGNVHANGRLSVSGSFHVCGAAGYNDGTGNCNPGTLGSVNATTGCVNPGRSTPPCSWAPTKQVPEINPRNHYATAQFVMCPNGHVRPGPSYTPVPGSADPATECAKTTTPLANAAGSAYRGWSRTGTDASKGAKWDYGGNTAHDGVYYFFRGSATIGGNPGSSSNPWRATILAEATGAGTTEPNCAHVGGDIAVSGNPKMAPHSFAAPLALVAGRDLQISGNPEAGVPNFEGALVAHEQFGVSGNPRVSGVLISQDACDTNSGSHGIDSPIHASHVSGNPTVSYDGNLVLPFGRTIRTTHWTEL